jgi:hypothetical protein
MLTGKYWLTAHGVIDVSASEHEIYARRWLCKVPDWEACEFPSLCRLFAALSPEEIEIFSRRGADREGLAIMLREGADLRPFMIKKYGWIRVRANAFWMNEPTPETLKLCRLAAYWKTQSKAVDCDMAEIIALGPGTQWNVNVSGLRGRKSWKEVLA